MTITSVLIADTLKYKKIYISCLQVSPEDILAFADRTIDTIEDVFMHATRAFMPAAKMNLPLSSDGQEEPPLLTATKKERIVVLGTGWGGHAISKVRVLLRRGPKSRG